MRFSKMIVRTACLLFLVTTIYAQDEPPCEAHPMGAALNFWLGNWRVVSPDAKTVYGQNVIEADLAGCVIFEHWSGTRGGEGKSLFYFNAKTGDWDQLWVTTDTSQPGGLKHKRLVDRFDDGSVRFQGAYPDTDGNQILDRTTLTPLENGDVRQLIEVSRDGGGEWLESFDATYKRESIEN